MKKTILAAAVLVASSSAFAEGMTDKMYVEGGWTRTSADLGISLSGVTVDEDDDTFRLGVGYNVNENFAVEAGVIGPAEASVSASGSITGTLNGKPLVLSAAGSLIADAKESYTLGGKLNLPVNDKFTAYAKGGMLWWDVDYKASGTLTVTYNGQATSISGSGTYASADGSDPYYGIGGSYSVTDKVSINADWLRTEIDGADIDAYSLTASMKF
jgi:opacity protein-like surface antigen